MLAACTSSAAAVESSAPNDEPQRRPRRVREHPDYSGYSLSDGAAEMNSNNGSALSGAGGDERQRRRVRRRRRGGKHRFVPYHARNSEEKMFSDDATAAEPRNERRKSLRSSAPMAPSNTTQFLLEDREARVEAEKDELDQPELRRSARLRSLSVSSDHFPFNSSDYGSTSGESEMDRMSEMEREFETEFVEFKRDRINELSKQEIVEQLLEREKDADLLAGECAKYVTENRQLKELLASHGIVYNTRSVTAAAAAAAANAGTSARAASPPLFAPPLPRHPTVTPQPSSTTHQQPVA